MFNKERSEDNFPELQKLLAMKRLELPPQSYFDGVLPEFHKRQRATLLQPRYTFVSRFFSAIETLREAFQPRPVLRYAFATSAAVVLVAAGLKVGLMDGSSLALQSTPAATNERFAYTQALEPQKVSNVDQQIDAASVGLVSLDNKTVMPHYVIAQAPTSYDVAMAF